MSSDRSKWEHRFPHSYTQDEFRAVERRLRGEDTSADAYLLARVQKRMAGQLQRHEAKQAAKTAEAAE